MDISECAQCGTEIEGKGIRFRARYFCGDECVEEFETDFKDNAEPDPDALVDEDFDPDDDLGYRDGDEEEFASGDNDDDDFAIDPDDF